MASNLWFSQNELQKAKLLFFHRNKLYYLYFYNLNKLTYIQNNQKFCTL